jgi:hypothetical protein
MGTAVQSAMHSVVHLEVHSAVPVPRQPHRIHVSHAELSCVIEIGTARQKTWEKQCRQQFPVHWQPHRMHVTPPPVQ